MSDYPTILPDGTVIIVGKKFANIEHYASIIGKMATIKSYHSYGAHSGSYRIHVTGHESYNRWSIEDIDAIPFTSNSNEVWVELLEVFE